MKTGSKIWKTHKQSFPLISQASQPTNQKNLLIFPSAPFSKTAQVPPLPGCFRHSQPDALTPYTLTPVCTHLSTHICIDTAHALTQRLKKRPLILKHSQKLQAEKQHSELQKTAVGINCMVNNSWPGAGHPESNPSPSLHACVVLGDYFIFLTLTFLMH